MCSNYALIKLEPALQRKEDKIKHLSSYTHVVHATANQVISRRGKNENVCEMSKNGKCTCKACKIIAFSVKYANLRHSYCRRRRACLSSLMLKMEQNVYTEGIAWPRGDTKVPLEC